MRRVQAHFGYLRIPTEVPIRKFPGPLGHPLTVWPGFFTYAPSIAVLIDESGLCGPKSVYRYRQIAAVHHPWRQWFGQTFPNTVTSQGHIEGTRVAIKISAAVSGSHRDSAFQGQRMFAAGVRQQGNFLLPSSPPRILSAADQRK